MKTSTLLLLTTLLILGLLVQESYQTPSVSRNWPKDWTQVKDWTAYIVYFALILALPALFFLVLYVAVFVFWLLRKCTICGCEVGLLGGATPRPSGYSKTSILISQIVFYICYAIIVALLVVALIFTITFSTSIGKIQKDTIGVFDTTYNKVDNMIDIVADIDNSVNDTLKRVDNVFTALNNFIDAFSDIDKEVSSASAHVNTIADSVEDIDSALQDLKDTLDDVKTDCNNQCPGSIPDASIVPSVSDKIALVNTAKTALNQMQAKTNSSRTTVNGFRDDMNSQIDSFKKDIDGQIGAITSDVTGPVDEVKKNLDNVDKYKKTVKKVVSGVDAGRIAVFLAIYVFLLISFTGALVGVICNSRVGPKVASCCAFWTAIIFLLIATIQLALFAGITDILREFEPGLRYNLDSIIGDKGQNNNNAFVPQIQPLSLIQKVSQGGRKISKTKGFEINSTVIIDQLLYCGEDGSFLDIAGFDISKLNVTEYTQPFDDAIDKVFNGINVTDLTSLAVKYLDDFSGYTNSLQGADLSANFSSVLTKVTDLLEKTSNISLFGYPAADAEAELADLNENSANIGGDYFTWANFTSLDPTSAPYNGNQAYFTNKKAALQNYETIRGQVQTRVDNIRVSLVAANNSLVSIMGDVDDIEAAASGITQDITDLRGVLNGFQGRFDNVKNSAQSVIDYAKLKVTEAIDSVLDLVSCSFVGTWYSNTKTNLQSVATYSGVICIATYLLTLGELLWFVLLLPATKRLGNAKHVKPDSDE